jgi:hypothetical protein
LSAEGELRRARASEDPKPSTETVALVLDGCLYALLGGPASSAFRTYIKRQSSVTIADLVDDPQKLHDCLQGVFGDSALVIEEFMVRSLVREFDLPGTLCVDLISTVRAAMT